MASAATKLRDFGDSRDHALDHKCPKTQSGQTLKCIPMFNTRLGSLMQLSILLLAIIKSNEQRLVGPACKTNLPPEVKMASGRLQQGRRTISSLVLHVRGNIHIGTLMPLNLAWCLHEVRHGRRRFIAVVCRVASFVSTVRLTTCRKEPNYFGESCLLKDPSKQE